ncbi:MAG: hypothetical protein KDA37_06915 [Planctomycetales bacterium]|nr:hypothetical protein [Planctomycetales bacterium]
MHAGQRVLLRISRPHRIQKVSLNDAPSAVGGVSDISDRLAATILLTVELVRGEASGQPLLTVQLEIC